jgi:two-component system OmpR family sensor kinase
MSRPTGKDSARRWAAVAASRARRRGAALRRAWSRSGGWRRPWRDADPRLGSAGWAEPQRPTQGPTQRPARPGLPGSLRGRLLWAFVGVVTLTAVIIGVVTFSLVRVAAASGLEQQLSDQAEAISSSGPLLISRQGCAAISALRAVQTELYLVDSGGTPHLGTCAPLRDRLRGAIAPAPDIDLRAALASGSVVTGTRGEVVYAAAPLAEPLATNAGTRLDGILLTHSLGGLGSGAFGGITWRLLLATGLAVAIAAAVAWVLASRLTAPLRRLAVAARDLGGGDLSTRVRVEGDDEVAEVGTAFNEMAADLERGQAEQRAFLASVSHELKTPLTAVQGYTEALLDGTVADPQVRQRSLERIHAETLRLARLVRDLLDLARLGRGQFEVNPVDADVGAVLREAVAAAADRAASKDVTVEQRIPDSPLLAHVDPGRLRQVLDNLLDNATRSTPPGHPVLVMSRPLSGGWVEVAVVDRGPGIAAEDLPHAFDRGYLWSRYRATRAVGSGLGLAIVKALCDAMGVTIRAESGHDHGRSGMAFRLALPPALGTPAWQPGARELPTRRRG